MAWRPWRTKTIDGADAAGSLDGADRIPIAQGLSSEIVRTTLSAVATKVSALLGLGTMATQNANSVAITGGTAALTSGTVAAAPSGANDLVNKSYADALALGVAGRSSVRAATTGNITIATALNSGDTLDGVTLATGDVVLVKDQTASAENGIYTVGATPARSAQFDTFDEIAGSMVVVEEGSTNADTLWFCTSNTGGTLNTTSVVFARIRIDIAVPVTPAQGGTGVINAHTITLGGAVVTAGSFTLAGAYAATFTFSGATNVTFPTSGTLASAAATLTSNAVIKGGGGSALVSSGVSIDSSDNVTGIKRLTLTEKITAVADSGAVVAKYRGRTGDDIGVIQFQNNADNTQFGAIYFDSTASGRFLFIAAGSTDALEIRGTVVNTFVPLNALSNTAIPAGGTAGAGLRVSSTPNFGVFFGSGAPTLSAAKGSLYLRSDGSGTNNRMYVNTDGGTTWTSVVTVA